ncbi:hypothetical protein CPC08DRAFT_720617 [Agrocybe pediades]|nr:hypothetical protein CPC08DRAFT_720617 [Agrocybe pediades]
MYLQWAMTITMKGDSHGLTFGLCVMALIPLIRLHDLSTKELALRIGGSRAGLLNGSMTNFKDSRICVPSVEFVVAISALRQCELRVVQSSHFVSAKILRFNNSNVSAKFNRGMRFAEQGFDPTATQVHSSLLSLSVGAVLLPAAYHFTLGDKSDTSFDTQKKNILHMSHGDVLKVSIVLLSIYFAYLLFQLWSHTHLYNDQHNKKSNRLSAVFREKRANHKQRHRSHTIYTASGSTSQLDEIQLSTLDFKTLDPHRRAFVNSPLSSSSDLKLSGLSEGPSEKGPYFPRGSSPIRSRQDFGGVPMSRESTYSGSDASFTGSNMFSQDAGDQPTQPADTKPTKQPQMSWFLTIFLLIVVTGFVAVTVDWLVEAMDGVSTTISKEWVGLILLPAVSSVAEIITAVKVSVRDELTLSVSVCVGSTIQTALLVAPFTVILAWITNKPLSLLMDPFQSLVLYIAVHTMGYVVADGKSNWLEGFILICLYVIIAVSFWFYPASTPPLTCTIGS